MFRLVAISLLLFAVACGDETPDIAETGTTVPSDEPETTAAPETTTGGDGATPEPTEIELTGQDYSFGGDGAVSVPAGVLTVTLENAGAEEHQATIVRLNNGVTLEQFGAAGPAALSLVTGYGGPNSVAPGESGTASAVVDEGSYLFVCFIPSPADDVPHSAKGMVLPFQVTAGQGEDAELEGDDTITLKDFTFEEPEGFDGQGTFTVANDGPQPHEAAVYALEDGKTAADVTGYLSAPAGPPPFSAAGGVAMVTVGKRATVELDLDTGSYVFMCFIPDTATGAPHFVQGMIKQFEIE